MTNLNETAVEESEADDVVRNHDSVSVGVDEGLFKKGRDVRGSGRVRMGRAMSAYEAESRQAEGSETEGGCRERCVRTQCR